HARRGVGEVLEGDRDLRGRRHVDGRRFVAAVERLIRQRGRRRVSTGCGGTRVRDGRRGRGRGDRADRQPVPAAVLQRLLLALGTAGGGWKAGPGAGGGLFFFPPLAGGGGRRGRRQKREAAGGGGRAAPS